ncbi:MAG: hypothetical protein ABUL60_05960 [Myxococcales bacterium]
MTVPLSLGSRPELLRRLQRRLERFYHLEETPDVRGFVRHAVDDSAREALLLRESEGELEMALVVPGTAANENDDWLQLAEGVSHFVYVANRARQELPSTQLELELQAEVDKFVLLVLEHLPFDRGEAFEVHSRLYERVRFLHAAGTELGDRYRTANDLAARFVRRLMSGGPSSTHATLRRFYRAGQAEKIRLVAA